MYQPAFAKEPEKLSLVKETFQNVSDVQGEIHRVYQIDGSDKEVQYIIPIPHDIFQKIKGRKDLLGEAKKELTVSYRYLKLEKRLQELNGIYLNIFPNAQVSVGDSLYTTFQEEIASMNQYADNEVDNMRRMSKEKQKELYDTSNLLYADYGKEQAFLEQNNPNFEKEKKEYEKMKKGMEKIAKESKETKQETPKIKDKALPIGGIIMSLIIISLVVSLTIFAFKKRG